jgi:Domain of unknown function (DUF4271)
MVLGEKKYNIILLFLMVFCSNILAQDNSQQSSELEKNSNTPSQVATPPSSQSEASRQRRRIRALNDSLKFAAQREIDQKKVQLKTAIQPQTNPVAPTVATPPVNTPPVVTSEKSQNPFDILRGESANENNGVGTTQNKTSPASSLLDKETYSKNFIFWVFLVVLILMAFIVAGGRSAIRTAYQAVTSDNALRQIYKEPMGWGSFGYLSLYVMFWINTGIFAFLLMSYYKMKPPFGFGQFGTFMACVAGVSGLIVLKHTVLYLVAKVFPIEKEVRTYNFIIMTVGIILGLILMPINIFVAYSDPKLSFAFVYLGIAMIVLAYLVRSLRSLPLAAPFLIDNRFHFLLYLCTVEIAPLLVISKIIMGNS